MDTISAWVSANAAPLLLVLLLLAFAAVLSAWSGRPQWSDKLPIPLLQRRIGLWLLALGGVIFAAIAIAIHAQGRLVAFDQRVTRSVAAVLGENVLQGLAYLSELGNKDVLAPLGVLVAIALFLTRHRMLAVSWAVTVLGSGLLIGLFKGQFERPRPVHEHGFAQETTWSFPSGHAAGSLVFYGMLAYVLMVRLPARWHRYVAALAALLVVSIGASRVLLQVHFLSDVLAGFAVGFAWLAGCVATTEFLRTSHHPRPPQPPSESAV